MGGGLIGPRIIEWKVTIRLRDATTRLEGTKRMGWQVVAGMGG
jgi:hypothetical protein